jgi:hypothetical protein
MDILLDTISSEMRIGFRDRHPLSTVAIYIYIREEKAKSISIRLERHRFDSLQKMHVFRINLKNTAKARPGLDEENGKGSKKMVSWPMRSAQRCSNRSDL